MNDKSSETLDKFPPAGTRPDARRLPFFTRAWGGRIVYTVVLALAVLYAISEHRKSASDNPAMETASVRFSVYLIAEGLQAYRDSTGTLPATLGEVDLDEEGIEYITNGDTYRLVALDGANSIVYLEGDSPKRFGAAFNVLEGGAVR